MAAGSAAIAAMASLLVACVIGAGILNSPIGYFRSTLVIRLLYNETFESWALQWPAFVADGRSLEEILDATFPVWNEGLTREAYAR